MRLREVMGRRLSPENASELSEFPRDLRDPRNTKAVIDSREPTICALFREQAARTPEATALIFGDDRLTYAELDERSDLLARRLRSLGVAAQSHVGLCVERSFDMIVGILAILKAGGAYVPIEPANPLDRLSFIVTDAEIDVLVTQSALEEQLSELPIRLALIDDSLPSGPEVDDALPDQTTTADGLAYIIYTSGSTGQPKGCMLTHRNVVHLFEACREHYDFGQDDAWTFFHSFAFDFSVWEIWGALLKGGRLVIVPREVAQSPADFWKLILEQRVTVLNQTPSAFFALMEAELAPEIEQDRLRLRYIIFGGERLDPRCLKPWFARHGDRAPLLVNMYGITETTVHVTYRELSAHDAEQGGSPIGRALPGYQTYLLDDTMKSVPSGEPGELYVGGEGLARGYVNRPELTAQKFIANPFVDDPLARLYRSGDLARCLPDGELEYLGRVDFQVKVRGFRIELGEIESALQSMEGVRQAVVLAHEVLPGDTRLAAYLLGVSQTSDEAIRQGLSRTLPDYMVPWAFIWLDSFPLTSSGKVDRRELPVPRLSRNARIAYEAPRTPTELALAAAWSEVLGVERVGAYDNFFELGGHSLAATRLVTRIRQSFGVEFPVRAVFEAPTLSAQASRIAAASQEGRGSEALATPPVVSSHLNGSQSSLTPAQWRLWFLERLSPAGCAYNESFADRLIGPFDAEALACAVGEVVRRHEALRTVFRAGPTGDPIPVVLDADGRPWTLAVDDLTGIAEDRRWLEVQTRLTAEAEIPFDLERGPLLRCRLFRLAADDHVVQLTTHHITCDGWSLDLIFGDLTTAYTSAARGEAPTFPDLSVTYGDYAAWQAQRLEEPEVRDQLGWWLRELDGLDPTLDLPVDRPHPPVASHRGGAIPIEIPKEVAAGLLELGRSEGASPFMVLLAGYVALLRRYTGREDLAVGTPVANRLHSAFDQVVGCFVNLLAMRLNVPGDPTFRQLVREAKERTLDALAHQELPFERIVEALNPVRDTGQQPIVQTAFSLVEPSRVLRDWGGLVERPVSVEIDAAKFDLLLTLGEEGGAYRGTLRYASDIFDASTSARIVGHLTTLFQAAAVDPDQLLAQLPLLTAAEVREQAAWNDTATPYPRDRSLVSLFQERVTLSPDASAIEDGEHVLTYRELAQRTDRFAARLRRAGVTSGTNVGLLFERSTDAIVAILATLKAGGTYVPLDPGDALPRLGRILANCSAVAVLTGPGVDIRIASVYAGTVIRTQDDPGTEVETWAEGDAGPATADSPAYVIYTSGSTGEPKGVVVPHRGVVRLVVGTDYVQLGPADRVAQASTLAFDAATFEIWGALLNGSSLVIVPRETVLSPTKLAERLATSRISTLFLTPALFHQMAWIAPDAFRGLRHLVVGGDVLDPVAARAVLASPGRPDRLINGYGPTESTTFATWHEVQPEDVVEGAPPIPIGRPIANTRVSVLDSARRPLPVGVAGELWLGGDGLAIGYWNAPELTAERFVVDPFGDGSEPRLYRTGDRARFRSEGAIEFLGRLDNQVKLRGFRIEPAEIEAVLRRQSGVADAAVIAVSENAGDLRLVAYVVPEGAAGLPADLRAAIGTELPAYLVPSQFVELDRLPLTAGGKVDRRRLPVPSVPPQPAETAQTDVGPIDETTQAVLGLWSELFPDREIGIHDDFFALGGHSLMAVRLFARVEQVFGSAPSLTTLLREPTVSGFAAALRQQTPTNRKPSQLVPLGLPGNAEAPPFICFPGGGSKNERLLGHGLSLVPLARSLGTGYPFYGVSLAEPPCGQTFGEVLPAYAEQVLSDLRTTVPHGPYFLGGYSLGGLVALEVARCLLAAGEEIGLLALLDVYGPGFPKRRGKRDRAHGHFAKLREMPIRAKVGYLSGKIGERWRRTIGNGKPGHSRRTPLWDSYSAYLNGLPRYPGRITLLRAAIQPENIGASHEDRTNGWGTIAEGGVEVIEVPGDHLTMLDRSHLPELAKALRGCLRRGLSLS